MDFNGIVAEVLAATKRPDKILAIQREVNQALVHFSSRANFSRDLYEQLYPIDAQLFIQSIPFSSLQRYRKMKYIKRAGTKEYLELLSSGMMTKNCTMVDKYYIAGSGINIAMSKTASNLDIGYYQYPPFLTQASPDHWMLEQGWPMIFNKALAKIFADIGDDSSSKLHDGHAMRDWEVFYTDVDKDLG